MVYVAQLYDILRPYLSVSRLHILRCPIFDFSSISTSVKKFAYRPPRRYGGLERTLIASGMSSVCPSWFFGVVDGSSAPHLNARSCVIIRTVLVLVWT